MEIVSFLIRMAKMDVDLKLEDITPSFSALDREVIMVTVLPVEIYVMSSFWLYRIISCMARGIR